MHSCRRALVRSWIMAALVAEENVVLISSNKAKESDSSIHVWNRGLQFKVVMAEAEMLSSI